MYVQLIWHLCSSFLFCLCFGVPIALVSPHLSVLPPEVLKVSWFAWHNSWQCIFVLCCWLGHASFEALNCAHLPQLVQSQHYNLGWKGLPEVI